MSRFSGNQTTLHLKILLGAFIGTATILFLVLPVLTKLISPLYAIGFADDYDRIAINIASGNGYKIATGLDETMMREPGYPLFLAIVFKLAGYNIEAARLANLLLALGIAVMIIIIARRITNDELTASIAALLFLLHPGTLIAEARGGVEILFIFALMIFVLVLHDALKQQSTYRYFISGLALGLVALIRSTTLLLPLFLLIYLLLFQADKNIKFARLAYNIALLILGMVLTISPWVIRNYYLTHQFIPTATVQGVAAQEGQYTCKHSSVSRGFQQLQNDSADERNRIARGLGVSFKPGYYQYFYHAADEVAFNKKLLSIAVHGYVADPELFARCTMKNILNFWFLGKTSQSTVQNMFVQVPLLILAVGGIYILSRQGRLRSAGIILMIIVYFIFMHAPIIAHARHSVPTIPFVAIFASISLVSIWRALRARNSRTTLSNLLG